MQTKFTTPVICLLLISAKPAIFKSENREVTKYYVPVPAKDASHKGFYISSIEITNKQYRDFLNDLRARGETEKLKSAMVDSVKWKSFLGTNNEPYVNYYFQHPAYDNYPVVNVSQQGALLYCQWLTEKYNTTARVKVRFDLPNEEQWVRAAQGGDSSAVYAWHGASLTYKKRGKWYKSELGNYKHHHATAGANTNNENADITAPSISYLPNAYGIYNMSGNVAEMIAGKNYTKGGSWISPPDKLTLSSKEEYAASAGGMPNVGFRPIMQVLDGE